MRCDKCGKRFDDGWVPSSLWPRYDITQRLGVLSHTSKINLCDDCSKKFKEWLENEENEKTDRC